MSKRHGKKLLVTDAWLLSQTCKGCQMNEQRFSEQLVRQIWLGSRTFRDFFEFREILEGLTEDDAAVLVFDTLLCHAKWSSFCLETSQDGRYWLIFTSGIGESVPPITALTGQKYETDVRSILRIESGSDEFDDFARSRFRVVKHDEARLAFSHKR